MATHSIRPDELFEVSQDMRHGLSAVGRRSLRGAWLPVASVVIALVMLGVFLQRTERYDRAQSASQPLLVSIKREGDHLRFFHDGAWVWRDCVVQIGGGTAKLASLEPGSSSTLPVSAFGVQIGEGSPASIRCTEPNTQEGRVTWTR